MDAIEVFTGNESEAGIISIPVVIDDIKQMESFSMARCSYFCIQSETESFMTGTLNLSSARVPVLMMGVTAIIVAPSAESDLFITPQDYSDLFDLIEKDEELYVDTNDIWLPNVLFGDQPQKRGGVYRVGSDLFMLALQYRNEEISDESFYTQIEEMQGNVRYSPEETTALSGWSEYEINLVRTMVRENTELRELRFDKEKGE